MSIQRPLKFGVAYHGNRFLSHAMEDMRKIAAAIANSPLESPNSLFSGTQKLPSFYLFNFYKTKCISQRREPNLDLLQKCLSSLVCSCPRQFWAKTESQCLH